MAVKFPSFDKALAWGRTYACEHCHAHQRWRIVRYGAEYRVGVFSRNSGAFSHFATV